MFRKIFSPRTVVILSSIAVLSAGAVQAAPENATTAATVESLQAVQKAENAQTQAAQATKQAEVATEKAQAVTERLSVFERLLAQTSHRSQRRLGAIVSLWGDPFPTTYGMLLAYNVYDFLRVNIAVGSNDEKNLFKIETLGVGAKLFVPGWEISPMVGMNLTLTKSPNATEENSVQGYSPRNAIPYATLGIGWQTAVGLDFSVGYSYPLLAQYRGSYYFQAGLFF